MRPKAHATAGASAVWAGWAARWRVAVVSRTTASMGLPRRLRPLLLNAALQIRFVVGFEALV
jgi:hypothetical protein